MAKKDMYTTPIGTFSYPSLNRPDTKFNPDGKYKVDLILPAEEASEWMQLITEAADKAYQELVNIARKEKKRPPARNGLPFYPVVDIETGEETGDIGFKFNMNASGIDKKTKKPWTHRPVVYDAKGAVIDMDKVPIWGGSRGRVSFFIHPYSNNGAGVTLKFEAVQVIELVSSGQKSAKAFGFTAEEGYTVDESKDYEEEEVSTSATDTEAPDVNEDF